MAFHTTPLAAAHTIGVFLMRRSEVFSFATQALVALSLALGTQCATAAAVSWSNPVGITGDADVRTNGSLVMAYNLGGDATTVNGVTFDRFVITGNAPAWPTPHVYQVGNATLAVPVREDDRQVLINTDAFTTLGPFSRLSAEYQTLLRSSAASTLPDRFDKPAVLTLAGLVVGQQYEFQTWFNDSTVSGCCAYGLGLWDAEDANNGVSLTSNSLRDVNDDVVEGGLGEHVLATFTADASTQSFAFMRSEVDGGLNAFQLRQLAAPSGVPTPGSLPLLAAALLALGLSSRTRRTG